MISRLLSVVLVSLASFAVAQLASAAVTLPLKISANGRYLVDQAGTPFPILGRAYWGIIGLSTANYRTAIDDWVAKGGNAIEVRAPNGTQRDNFVPKDGAGNLPFTTKIGGGAYGGSFSDFPDFTTPNEPYWAFLDAFISYCASKNVVVLLFPAYIGYDGDYASFEGWGAAMKANGKAKMQTFGAYVANRYKSYKNIIWMVGGDIGTGGNQMGSALTDVEAGFIAGLKSVSGQQSTQYAAEWGSNSFGDDQPNFGSSLTLNSVYSFSGDTATWTHNGYSDSPTKPTFLLEEPYDEEGPDGTNVNSAATQPVRRYIWWGVLGGIGGYMAGNGYIWPFFNGYASHFNTQGQIDLSVLNAFWSSIPWYQLVPSELAGMKKIVVSGNDVGAAATPAGTWLVAYVPPSTSGSISIDMTVMSASARARWLNPTTGALSTIGTFANSGTHSFTMPGNNGTGFSDWVLVLDTGGTTTDILAPSPPTNLTVVP